jgi:hypothetical protein
MAKPKSVIGWKLDRSERAQLLRRFPPRYRDVIADHVTLETEAEKEPLPDAVEAAIVSHADDGDSLECMVVTINDSTDRPDGSNFHITWSLDKSKGRHARESNDLLRDKSWKQLDHPVSLDLEPARFP